MKTSLMSLVAALGVVLPFPQAAADFAITEMLRDPATGSIALTWTTTPGNYYYVMESNTMQASWVRASEGNLLADSAEMSYTLPNPGSARKFFRILESSEIVPLPKAPLASVALYDENLVQLNIVDKDAYEDDIFFMSSGFFQALVAAAYPNGEAGIADFERFDNGAVIPDGFQLAEAAPTGIGQGFEIKLGSGTGPIISVTMGDENDTSAAGWTVRDRVTDPTTHTPISGSKCLEGPSQWDFVFDPQDRVTAVGFTILSADGIGFPTNADIEVFYYDVGEDFEYSEYLDFFSITGGNGTDDTFVGIRSEIPETTAISRIIIRWEDSAVRHTGIDDFGVVVTPAGP